MPSPEEPSSDSPWTAHALALATEHAAAAAALAVTPRTRCIAFIGVLPVIPDQGRTSAAPRRGQVLSGYRIAALAGRTAEP